MTNHPNRGRRIYPAANPPPDTIRAVREAAGLTQAQAGAVVYSSMRAWQQWESGERRMHPAFWELYLHKVKAKQGESLKS